ncbi:MAG: Holliday junction DNA helicase RuvA [Candidatus Azotimanducaceae bacterium]|jgi:Holliday junction DNA helicase RuvA
MIGRIKGLLVEKLENFILVDVGGVAYEIEIPTSTFVGLGQLDETVLIHTHMVVREDAQLLFGFFTLSERSLFRSLIKVNGVGPKLAIAILSGLDVAAFCRCVSEDNVNALVAISGVGKKTAERLIIEMRDRLPQIEGLQTAGTVLPISSDKLIDAETALVGLGFRPTDVSRALALIENKQDDTGNLIKQALKILS